MSMFEKIFIKLTLLELQKVLTRSNMRRKYDELTVLLFNHIGGTYPRFEWIAQNEDFENSKFYDEDLPIMVNYLFQNLNDSEMLYLGLRLMSEFNQFTVDEQIKIERYVRVKRLYKSFSKKHKAKFRKEYNFNAN